jgi:hypothetical protein
MEAQTPVFDRIIVNYSTPCLFAAQEAIEETLQNLQKWGGLIEKNRV